MALTLGISVLVLLFILADWRELLRTAASIEPWLLVPPLVLTFLSYAAMSRSYQGIADIAGCFLPFSRWLRITFVSNTANYLVTSAGLSGFAVRMYLLSQHGVVRGRAVLISLVQTLLTNFTLLFFILGGFATLVLRKNLSGIALVVAVGGLCAFTGVLVLALVLAYQRRLRRLTLLRLANVAHRLLHTFVPHWAPRRVGLWRFQHNLNKGLEFMLERKNRIVVPTAWIMLDWVLTIGILWSAFRAVHYAVPLGVVAIGFSIGIFFSVISFVPAGLGIMEGSMTGAFVTLAVPKEPALVAVLIFRISYFIVPMLVSLVLFPGVVFKAASTAREMNEAPPPVE